MVLVVQVAHEKWHPWQTPLESMKNPGLQRHLEELRKAFVLQVTQLEGALVAQLRQVLSQTLQTFRESR